MPKFTTSDGLQLFFTDEGTGKPILCLPGLTRSGDDFEFAKPHLSQYRMLTLDFRGRGQSDHDPTYMNYNIPREAQDVIEFLNHIGLERTALLGTSRGGLVSMTLAATQADRLSAVILNDIGPVIEPVGLVRIMDYVGKPLNSQTLAEAAAALQTNMATEFPGVPADRWQAQTAILYDQTANGLALRYDPKLRDAMLEQAAAGPAPDLWPLFDALRPFPAGAIRGANSDLFSAQTLAEMKSRHPGLITCEVPDRGHVPFLDEPEALEVIHKVMSEV